MRAPSTLFKFIIRFKPVTSFLGSIVTRKNALVVCVSTQAPNGASRAVGTHHRPTRIHMADYSLRDRRDGNAGTTILYHLRTYRHPHSSSGMTAGRRELLGMGTAAASAGTAGPSQGPRAGWSSGRTEAGVRRGERTTHLRERADDRDSEPDYLLRPTRHGWVVHCSI